MLTGYQAVIFDFFGTLTRATRRGPGHAATALALGCDPVAFAAMLDRTYHDRASGHYGDARAALACVARALGRSPGEADLTEALRLRMSALAADIQLRADAISTLWTIRRHGLRTGLLSDCPDEIPPLVGRLPIASMLDAAVFSVHLGVTKPDPALFLTVCERIDVPPTRCVYVGDGGGRELSGARAVGMTAVRLTAPDLADHLVFDRERDWSGACVSSLAGVLDLDLATTSRHRRHLIPTGPLLAS